MCCALKVFLSWHQRVHISLGFDRFDRTKGRPCKKECSTSRESCNGVEAWTLFVRLSCGLCSRLLVAEKAVPLLGNVETLLKKPNVADDFHFLREGRLRAGGTLRKLLTWKVRRWWNCHILLNQVRLQHDLCVHVESCAIYSLGNQFHFVPPWSVVVPPKSNQHLVYLLGFVCLEVWTFTFFPNHFKQI